MKKTWKLSIGLAAAMVAGCAVSDDGPGMAATEQAVESGIECPAVDDLNDLSNEDILAELGLLCGPAPQPPQPPQPPPPQQSPMPRPVPPPPAPAP